MLSDASKCGEYVKLALQEAAAATAGAAAAAAAATIASAAAATTASATAATAATKEAPTTVGFLTKAVREVPTLRI